MFPAIPEFLFDSLAVGLALTCASLHSHFLHTRSAVDLTILGKKEVISELTLVRMAGTLGTLWVELLQ